MTSTTNEPLIYAGIVAVIEVGLMKVTLAAGIAPKLAVELRVKPVPVKVTTVPPVTEPVLGVIPVNVGAFAI